MTTAEVVVVVVGGVVAMSSSPVADIVRAISPTHLPRQYLLPHLCVERGVAYQAGLYALPGSIFPLRRVARSVPLSPMLVLSLHLLLVLLTPMAMSIPL